MPDSLPLRIFIGFYEILLRVYPAEFRAEYGAEMLWAFRASCREAFGSHAWRKGIVLLLRTLIDVSSTAPGEHMEILVRDLRFAFRIMGRRPLFTFAAVVALALGIGANSAVFSVVDGVLLRSLPYERPELLVWISGNNLSHEIEDETASGPDFLDWKDRNRSFEEMACFVPWRPVLTGSGEAARLDGGAVSISFFKVLGAEAALGRTFTPEEDRQEQSGSAILSYGLWQRRFGGDRSILGRTLKLGGVPMTVVGVMPRDFVYPGRRPAEIWRLYTTPALARAGRRSDHLGVIGRLSAGASLGSAGAEMNTIAAALEKQYPESNTGWRVTLTPLLERQVGGIETTLLVLQAAAGFLLLIACVNVANLILVRGMARRREIALRTVLGAARRRLIRQYLTESILLALLGGIAGLVLSWLGIQGLVAMAPPGVPRLDEVGLDLPVLGFTVAVALLTGVVFGLIPALQISRPRLSETLKEGAWGASHAARSRRIRSIMTVAEVALALVLLIGAGLMTRSYIKLQSVDPGFDPSNLLTFRLSLPAAGYAEDSRIVSFHEQLLACLEALPGVSAAGAASDPPLLAGNYLAFRIQGRPPLPPEINQDAEVSVATAGYFHTMGIPLKRGRLFSSHDRAQGPPVVLVSERMAERYWPGEDPIGAKIAFNEREGKPLWREIVGVVGGTRADSLDARPYEQFYVPLAQAPQRSLSFLLRTGAGPMSLVPAVRATLRSLDPDQPLSDIATMEQVLHASIARQRLGMLMLGVFSVTALILAGVGVYGVMAFSASQRTREIGVRIALGAGRGDTLKLVIGQGMTLAGIGVGCGLLAAAGLTRLIENLLFEVRPLDVATFAAISAVLLAVALLACYVPARRACRVDPMTALRSE